MLFTQFFLHNYLIYKLYRKLWHIEFSARTQIVVKISIFWINGLSLDIFV